ncbi:MAG: hypothetical protein Q4P28_04450 [Tissierellia bacterium]|nr:hypothetical protein [Tissierellia bacterium]
MKKDIWDMRKLEKEILMLGYLAQDICLMNAGKNVYNRPLKQVLSAKNWKRVDMNKGYPRYYQFYGVVSGYCDDKECL